MTGRILVAGMLGVLVGVCVALGGGALAASGEGLHTQDAPSYVMLTSFVPDEAWTEEYAQAGIRKLSAVYTADAIEGFETKVFVGDFERNEFGGVYRFANVGALLEFLLKHPPAENRTVKTFRVLGEWKAEHEGGS
ncbi:MAG: hypothetical protein ABGY41_02055 [Candidatus Poribacteria bacterium]